MEEREKGKGKGSERWTAAIANLSEMAVNLDSLQKLLVKKAVYVDEETFAKASLSAEQSRTIKVLEQRVETLERELDAAISAAARARTEKRQAEAGQKAAELRAQEVTRELENTTRTEINMNNPEASKSCRNSAFRRCFIILLILQKYLNCTWKSYVQNNKRFLSVMMKLNF